jgi:hypothetical protein
MNDETTNLDQADEEILAYTVSDEALEDAGEGAAATVTWPGTFPPPCP